MKKDILHFFPSLLSDTHWLNTFLDTSLAKNRQLTNEDLYLLLHHFKATSQQAGALYESVAAAKKHSANWFRLNHQKSTLLDFINEGKKKERKARIALQPILTKTNYYFDTLLKRQCKTDSEVRTIQEQLQRNAKIIESKSPLLSKEKERDNLSTFLADINKMNGKLENAASLNQLSWFCGTSVASE